MKKILFILSLCFISIYSFAQLTIEQQPVPMNRVCVDDTVVLRMAISGNIGPSSFTLQKEMAGIFNSIAAAIIVNGDILEDSIFQVQLSDEGRYRYLVENGSETVYSTDFIIQVSTTAPIITALEYNTTILCPNSINTIFIDLNINAAEHPVYTWFKNNIGQILPISNDTTYIYYPTINSAGNYYLLVTNGCGRDSTYDEPINFTYMHIPDLVSPNIPIVCEGTETTITVSYIGEEINFQWYQRLGSDTTTLTTQTTNVLTLENLPYPNAAIYWLVAENFCGTDTLHDFGVATNGLPDITNQPISNPGCQGAEFTLNAYANSNIPVTYYWFAGAATTPIYTTIDNDFVINTSLGTASYYYYVAENTCGTDTSNIVSLVFNTPPVFTISPIDKNICTGDDLLLDCKVTGTEPITITWMRIIDNMGVQVQFPNSTLENDNRNLIITEATISQGGKYFVRAVNSCGTAYSDTATVIINDTISINLDLSPITLCEGEDIVFHLDNNLQISGSEPIIYTWYKENLSGGDVVVATDLAVLTIEDSQLSDAGIYYCEVSNMCNTKQTSHVSVTINPLPHIITQPEPVEICVGEDIHLEVEADGMQPLSYLWYKNNSALPETSDEINYTNAQMGRTGYYHCLVHNSCGDTYSDTVFVSVGTEASIMAGPTGVFNFCEFQNLQLFVFVAGENYNVDWYHNGFIVNNESNNDTVLLINNAAASYSGEYYCRITNACTDISSNTVNISITPAPIVDLGPDLEFCEGESATLETNGTFASYTWNDGTHLPAHTVVESGTYILTVIDGTTYCTNSDTVIVAVHSVFNPQLNATITECAASVVLNPGQGAYSYLWNNGATTPTITVTVSGMYSVTVAGDDFGCMDSTSTFVTLKEPVSVSLGDDRISPIDIGVTISVPAGYDFYLWNTGFTGPALYVDGETYGLGTHVFWIYVSNESGCSASDTINVTFIPFAGIEQNNTDNSVLLFPNPANNYVNITSESDFVREIAIFSIEGKELLSKKINSKEERIDINSLSAGTYFVKILTAKNILLIKKFVKN